MVKEKQSAKAVLEALKIDMAQPHMTASALAVLCPDAEQRKLILDRIGVNLHRQIELL
jgi:hypothetical protein